MPRLAFSSALQAPEMLLPGRLPAVNDCPVVTFARLQVPDGSSSQPKPPGRWEPLWESMQVWPPSPIWCSNRSIAVPSGTDWNVQVAKVSGMAAGPDAMDPHPAVADAVTSLLMMPSAAAKLVGTVLPSVTVARPPDTVTERTSAAPARVLLFARLWAVAVGEVHAVAVALAAQAWAMAIDAASAPFCSCPRSERSEPTSTARAAAPIRATMATATTTATAPPSRSSRTARRWRRLPSEGRTEPGSAAAIGDRFGVLPHGGPLLRNGNGADASGGARRIRAVRFRLRAGCP